MSIVPATPPVSSGGYILPRRSFLDTRCERNFENPLNSREQTVERLDESGGRFDGDNKKKKREPANFNKHDCARDIGSCAVSSPCCFVRNDQSSSRWFSHVCSFFIPTRFTLPPSRSRVNRRKLSYYESATAISREPIAPYDAVRAFINTTHVIFGLFVPARL